MNEMNSFIHFLSGILVYDVEKRWTPRMAFQHPFIHNSPFNGSFTPEADHAEYALENKGIGGLQFGEGLGGDALNIFKQGSCPGKVLTTHQAFSASGPTFPMLDTGPSYNTFFRPQLANISEDYFKGNIYIYI